MMTIARNCLLLLILMIILLLPSLTHAQSRFFAGGAAGIATLSADGQTEVAPQSVAFATYRPFNGPAVNIFAGVHFNDFLSAQGNYIWNRNDLTVTSSRASSDSVAVDEEERGSSQDSFILDLLLYFRDRASWARPYLSVGTGVVRFNSDHRSVVNARGSTLRLPPEYTTSELPLRVAVGIDMAVGRGFAVRYSFSETITANPVSSRLVPRGERNMANFQNLFGIVKYF
jgi:hypothetical protein